MAPSRSKVRYDDGHLIYNTAVSRASKAGAYTFIRVTALTWANILASFALYVIINYLTSVWNLSITHAAGIVNIWNGIMPALSIVFSFFASFMDSYHLLVLSSIAFNIGLGLLSLSTPNLFGPCNEYKEDCIGHKQKVLFFIALPLMAVGMAGHAILLSPFLGAQIRSEDGAEDRGEDEAEDGGEIGGEDGAKGGKMFLQTVGTMILFIVIIAGSIALPYIKPWSIRFGIPAICSLTATGLLLTGSPSYKRNKPEGSHITTALRVFVAAASKDFQQVQNFKQIYNDDDTHSTSSLRWLDKAAIKFPDQARSKSWTLCTVREVEDTKIGIRMVPLCLALIVPGLVLSIGNTYFLEQANHMDRNLGSIKVQIPIFLLFYSIFTGIWSCTSMVFPLSGVAMGMILSILCCITAAIVETRRLHVVRDHGLLDKSNGRVVPMSVFSLLPQFLLLAGADMMTNFVDFFDFTNNVPGRVGRYLIVFQKAVKGFGSMASVLLVYVVGKVSDRNNNPNWFQHTLNKSRLDRYYWTLAGISAVNLVIYVIVARFYTDKSPLDESEPEPQAEAEAEAANDGRN